LHLEQQSAARARLAFRGCADPNPEVRGEAQRRAPFGAERRLDFSRCRRPEEEEQQEKGQRSLQGSTPERLVDQAGRRLSEADGV
jgi:hypothetical protein